jgi:hypothetical protein
MRPEVVDTKRQGKVVDTEQQREVVDTAQQGEVLDPEEQREVVDTDQQGEFVDTAQQGAVLDPEEQRHVIFTARQRELLRTRVDAYRDVQDERRGLSWPGLCDEIFDLVHVHVRHEFLRQWVEEFIEKKKKQPRRPNNEEFAGIASFLMHPEIGILSEEELNKPEIPLQFFKFLLDFFAYPGQKQLYPPKKLGGRYLAVLKNANGGIWKRIELKLEVRERDHVIRASDASEEWLHAREIDFGDNESSCEKSKADVTYRAKGAGVIMPEGNLILFMKHEPSGRNHCYWTIALHPDIWSGTPPTQFALLRHADPPAPHLALLRHAYPVPQTPDSRTLPDLMKETDGDTVLLHFSKLPPVNTDS